MNDRPESSEPRTFAGCESYVEAAQDYVLDLEGDETLARVDDHMKVCSTCRERLTDLLSSDAAVRSVFNTLGDSLPDVDDRSMNRILSHVRKTPETAVLLRRIRRPVNALLMLAFLAASTGALALLALWLVRMLKSNVAI